jgi:hypothetical protein
MEMKAGRELLLEWTMEPDVGTKSLIESADQHAGLAKAIACCGASENVFANLGFRAHSEFNFSAMNHQSTPRVLRSANAFSTTKATGGYL